MHILGKVFPYLIVLAAIFASIFTSRMVSVRNSWTKKVIDSKNKTAATLAEIEKLEAKIESVKNEFLRSQELWGSPWSNVQTQFANQDEGILSVNIGASSGVRQDLVMHGFEIAPDGSSIYRGSFSPVEIRDTSAQLKPNWRPMADDISTWQPGNWRWRNTLPPGYHETFDRQLLAIVKLMETLGDRGRTLAGQQALLEQANNSLKMREAELVGGELLGNSESADPEFRLGLVTAVEQAEEDRNQELLKVDELRRKVRAVQAEIGRLQADNANLVQKHDAANSRNGLTRK